MKSAFSSTQTMEGIEIFLILLLLGSVSARGERGHQPPPFMMQGGLAPFTLQSNVLKLPLFSLN
jgi:hypothetical protein